MGTLLARARGVNLRGVDAIVAAALVVIAVALAAGGRHHGALPLLAVATACATVAWRWRAPATMVIVAVASSGVFAVSTDGGYQQVTQVALLLDYYALGRVASQRGRPGVDVALLAVPLVTVVGWGWSNSRETGVGLWALSTVVPYAAGRAVNPREREVFLLVANGMSNAEIANQLLNRGGRGRMRRHPGAGAGLGRRVACDRSVEHVQLARRARRASGPALGARASRLSARERAGSRRARARNGTLAVPPNASVPDPVPEPGGSAFTSGKAASAPKPGVVSAGPGSQRAGLVSQRAGLASQRRPGRSDVPKRRLPQVEAIEDGMKIARLRQQL